MNILKEKKLYIAVIIAIVLELFVFNFKHWESLFYKEIPITDYDITSNTKEITDNVIVDANDSGLAEIEIKNINSDVKNIYIDAYNFTATDPSFYKPGIPWDFECLNTFISVSSSGYQDYCPMPTRYISVNVERSRYIRLMPAGKTKDIVVTFLVNKHSPIIIEKISLNKKVPLFFIPLRAFVVFILIYAFSNAKQIFACEQLRKRKKLIVFMLLIADLVFCGIFIAVNPRYRETDRLYRPSDQCNFFFVPEYDLLARAMLHGQLYLEEEPPKWLARLENPYDVSARDALIDTEEELYFWDVAYFNGKYYVYFGLLPVLLFYIPWRLVFGSGLPTSLGVYLCICIFIIFAFLLLKEIIDRYFPNTPFRFYLLMTQVLIFSCGLPYALRMPSFYYTPILLALALVTAGLYFLFRTFRGGKAQVPCLALGCLCMALVALCRPQFLAASFLTIPLFADVVIKNIRHKKAAVYAAAFLVPYIAVAAVTMWYNYARFGSVFDFGANYNLTTNDVTSRGFNLYRIPLGIFAYFFQPPVLTAVFPFITNTDLSTCYMGITVSENMYGGIFMAYPITWLFLAIKEVIPIFKEKKLWHFLLALPVISFAVGIADTEMGGILSRYSLDIAFYIILFSVITAFALIGKAHTQKTGRIIFILSTLCLIFDVFLCCTASVETLNIYNPDFYYDVAHTIAFWM